MFSKVLRLCLTAVSLLFAVACTTLDNGDVVSVSIQGEYEKKTITSAGLSSIGFRPTRYCWVEGIDTQTGAVLFEGYLNSAGRGIAEVPRGVSFDVHLVARYEVPGKNDHGNTRMRGSIKNGPMSATYSDSNVFNAIPDWSVSSKEYSSDRDMSIAIKALDSGQNLEARAFNIADQAVEFAQKMGEIEPGLALPNLHSFWLPSNQYTEYPSVAFDKQHKPLSQPKDRTIFQHRVSGAGTLQTSNRGDECNDSALMESFAHILFADYSYPAVKPEHSYGRIARRDSEEIAWVDWQIASDSSVAFISGFCDFISAAFRSSHQIIDISSGSINTIDLSATTSFPKVNGGEFYRQSVASALYRVWTNGFSSSSAGLKTMWDATYTQGMAKGALDINYPYGYLQCPIGNISSYLSGLANGAQFGVTKVVWGKTLGVLFSESMGDPNAEYFKQGKFWKKIDNFSTPEAGTIKTYPDSDGIFWDLNQTKSFLFSHSSGSRRIALEMTGFQDLFLELFDGQGIIGESTAYVTSPRREITYNDLKPGEYLARVRAGNTTQEREADFRLVVGY